jgi:hypothetical protein
MSASMLLFQRLGLMGRMPPRRIIERTLHLAGIRRRTSTRMRKALATLAHFAFGGVAGALFETVGVALGADRFPRTAPLVYAFGIYATSYAGWVPAIGALPPPGLDRPGRQPAMIVAHLVFGATLAWVRRPWRREAPRPAWTAPSLAPAGTPTAR